MSEHWHSGIDSALYIVIVAIVGTKLIELGAAALLNMQSPIAQTAGRVLGGLVTPIAATKKT